MKWFKHFSDNHRGKSMQTLFDEMGHLGMSSWYILMEMCTEKLEKKWDKNLEDSDCLFEFHQRIVRRNLRISQTNLGRLLDICQGFGLLSFRIIGDIIEIKMPILLDLLESDQKKSRRCSVRIAPATRLESKLELNVDVDVVQNTPSTNAENSLVKENMHKHNSTRKFDDMFKPEILEFKKIIDELEIKSMPSLRRIIPDIARSYEYKSEDFKSWCLAVINSNSIKNIDNANDRARYFVAAIKREIGLTK